MLCNTAKEWVNHIKICIQSINRRKKKLVTTKTWGVVIIDAHPFFSTVFLYTDHTVKIRLVSKIQRQIYTYEFSSKRVIIDDYMLYLQKQQHTKQNLLKRGYKYDTY